MGDTCAHCGDRAKFNHIAPHQWETYLREERDYIPVSGVSIPLCSGCSTRAERLEDIITERDVYTEDERDEAMDRAETFLDELDLDLIEEPDIW